MSDTTDDQMSPDASPGSLSHRAGVRRVNNVPMYLIGGTLLAFVGIMAMVAADRAEKQKAVPEAKAEATTSNTSTMAKELTAGRDGGIVPAAAPPKVPSLDTPPVPPQGAVAIARPDLDAPPLPPPTTAPVTTSRQSNDEENRRRNQKMQQFEEAVKARTSIQTASARSPGSPQRSTGPSGSQDETLAKLAAIRQQLAAAAAATDDPTAAYKARLALVQNAGLAGAGGSGGGGAGASPRMQTAGGGTGGNAFAQFGNQGPGDRWQHDERPQAPRTPYELRAGFVIPATLISGINSDLPGQIIGQVSQDVFDTPTGEHKLIPQGARLVGTYASSVGYGQSRLLVAWQRIVFPDGKSLDLGSMPGADSAGYGGFNDKVNNHYWRLFSSAFLMSGVTAGIALSQPERAAGEAQTASSAISEALGQQLGQVTAQLISKNMNIAPTLEIRPGYRFNVTVTKDLTFEKPYQPFDY